MQSSRCLPIIMNCPLILCSVLASLSTTIARKHGPHSDPNCCTLLKKLLAHELAVNGCSRGTNHHTNKDLAAQTVKISERIPHPNVVSETLEYDIAMLKTAKDIQYNDAVYPIKFSLSMRGKQKTQNLIVAGWGLLGSSKRNTPEKLQEVRVEYLPFDGKVYKLMTEIIKSA